MTTMKNKLISKTPHLAATLCLTMLASVSQAGGLIAKPDRLNTSMGQAKTVEVLWNDRGGNFWVSKVNSHSQQGGRAYVVAGRKVHYTPKPGFRGTDQFWYEITDSRGRTNSSKVTVQVSGHGHKQVHHKPVQKRKHHKPNYSVQWSKPGFNFSYSKPGGWQATVTQPQHHQKRNYTPQKQHYQQPRVAAAPVGRSDAYVTYSGSGRISLDVLTNDKGAGLSIQKTNQWTSRGGQAWVEGNHIAYTPKPGFRGVDELWYVLKDKHGRTNSTKVSVSVH